MTSSAIGPLSAPCFVCRAAPRVRGLACAACVADLVHDALCPEQIRARVHAVPDMAGGACAWLIDGFGLPHPVRAPAVGGALARATQGRVTLGRADSSDVQIADRWVSHEHAHLEFRPLSHAWFIEDGGGDNGTFVNGDRVKTRFPLEPRDRVALGKRVGFVFLPLEDAELPDAARELVWLRSQFLDEKTLGDAAGAPDVVLKVAIVKEGGAIASWGTERVQLSELELELLVVLQRALEDDSATDAAARGFVQAERLLERLSFVSEAPSHANLRGLVRKLRKKLVEGEVPVDVIESRRGLGYRLARGIALG